MLFQKSRRRCTSSADLESTGDRVTAAPDGLSQTWSDKLRAGRYSLCGGEAASSTPRGGGVAARNSERHSLRRRSGCEDLCEASSDALYVGGVSGSSSRTLRGTAAVEESTGQRLTQECSATLRGTVISQQRVALRIARTIRKEREEHTQLQGRIVRKERKEHTQLQGRAIRKKRKEHSLTARHKGALQGRDGDDSHRSREEKPLSDDHSGDPAKRGGHQEGKATKKSPCRRRVRPRRR